MRVKAACVFRPPPQLPLEEGWQARPHYKLRCACVAIARVRQAAWELRSPPFSPRALLGGGSATRPHRMRGRGRVAIARGRHDVCHPRSTPVTAGGRQRRATAQCAPSRARRDRARQTRCVPLALRSRPPQPPLGEGSAVRPRHVRRRMRVAIARDRHGACSSRSLSPSSHRWGKASLHGGTTSATACASRSRGTGKMRAARAPPPPSPPPHPPLGEGSAAVPHHVRRRGRVTVARDRREACRSYSASHPCGHRWGRAVRGSSTVSAVQPCLLGGQAAPNDVLTRTAHAAVTLSGAGNVCGDPQAIRRDVRALVLRALRSANARRRTTSPCCGSSPRQQAASEPASMPSIIPGRPGPTSSPGRAARASGPTPRARTSAVSPGYANARHSRVPRPMRAHSVAPDVPPPPRGAAPGHGPAEPGRVCCAA